jgi:hypothetical protein
MKKPAILLMTLLCATLFAQDLPKIAVYVTGNVPEDEKTVLGTRMLASLVNSGRYTGIERTTSFLAEIEKEQEKQRSGAIDDNQISELGRQFGVKYVCIANITPAFGEFQVSARIVDVETAVVTFIGDAFSPLKTPDDLTQVSEKVVENMFGRQEQAKPEPKPNPQPDPTPTAPEPPTITMPSEIKAEPAAEPQPKPELTNPTQKPIKPSFWLGISLDAIGIGALAYGLAENGNVENRVKKHEYTEADKAVKNRNTAYIIGTAALIGGITIHILF